jgi:hypothetical protein
MARVRLAFRFLQSVVCTIRWRPFAASALLLVAACDVPSEAGSSGETTQWPAQTTRGVTKRPVVVRTPKGAVSTTAARVTHTIRRVTTQLVTLRTSEATVVTTPEHPFAKVGAGWTRAAELAVGDRIVTRDLQDAAIVEVEVREAPPTPVYNLSVANTHAYFVSDRDLLVHNMDCAPDSTPPPDSPPRPRRTLAEQSREFRNKRKRSDQPELDDLIERPKKRHKPELSYEAERKKFSRLYTPLNNTRDVDNCSSCTLAALSDVPSVSQFIEKYEHVPGVAQTRQAIDHDEIMALMRRLGLRSNTSPPPVDFPPMNAPIVRPFKEWDNVTKFMQESTANTFAVSFDYESSSGLRGHILIAARLADGSIVYLDFQSNPPKIVDLKAIASIVRVNVAPTDVDWRSNRRLFWHLPMLDNPDSPDSRDDSDFDDLCDHDFCDSDDP